jgi:hypothetical protein
VTTAESAPLIAPTTRWWLGWLLAPATILVIVVGAVLLLMTPLWMHSSIPAAGGGLPGYTGPEALDLSDRTVGQLIFGPGTFEGFTADEVAHLRDARLVLYLFLVPAAFSLVLVVSTLLRRGADPRAWRAVAQGGKILVVGAVVLGVIGALAFGAAFTLFHQIFFPGGNWTFPPDSTLIRLYPYAFWQLTAAALGVLCVAAGTAVWFYARRRAARLEARP